MTDTIRSPGNEKLKLVRRLHEGRGRARLGAFITEGEDLLAAGLAAGREPRFVLVREGESVEGAPAGAIPVTAELLDRASTLGSGTRVIAVWELPDPEPVAEGPAVFLDGVADPGNVGTIVRSAAALCGARVVLGPGTADAYSPKAARAAMGALHSHPPLPGLIEASPAPRLALDAHDGAPLDAEIERLRPATLVLGAEREGVSEETLAACEGVATIPLHASTESLNVAATAAIGLQRISSIAAAEPDHGSASGEAP